MVKALRVALAFAAACAATGCGGYLPSAGPGRDDIEDQAGSGARQEFVLVEVSNSTLDTLKRRNRPSFARLFGSSTTPPEMVIGEGDGLSITIWEAGNQPLFYSPPAIATGGSSARGTTLPEQTVDRDGSISIPFVGRVAVAGKTLAQAQTAVEQGLAGKTARPQVAVNLVRNVSNTVTVVGEGLGGRVALTPRGDRLLDLLASSGGIRTPAHETRITLTRGGESVTVPLRQVLGNSEENVYLQGGDVLVVTREPETFTAFGATGRNAQIPFDNTRVNLVEAVAKAGGLQDLRADPQGVFLFRREPSDLAAQLAPRSTSATASAPSLAGPVSVVYQLDLTRAGGYFLANEFDLRDGDVLYVSSAPANELQKFLQLLGLVTQPAIGAAVINNAVTQ